MVSRPELIPDEARRTGRYHVDFKTIAEAHPHQEFTVRITNISAEGMMLSDSAPMEKATRIIVRLPVVGRIEAYVIWSHQDRCGFKFERVVREDEFMAMLDQIK